MNCYVVAFDENENHRPTVTLPGYTPEEEAVNKGLEFIRACRTAVERWVMFNEPETS